MKRIYLYMLVWITIGGLAACSADFERIEIPNDYLGSPSTVSNITYEALSGQISLTWNVPADKNFYFLRVSYYDPLTKTSKSFLTTPDNNTLVIDNTRERYGDYEFTFQTFNRKDEGSEIQTIKARSLAAPITETITKKKVVLTEGQLSTNNQEPSEGPIKNLIDGSSSTFFHTRWSNPQIDMPQYIQVNLNEALTNFQFYYQNRNGSQVGPEVLEVQICRNGVEWKTIATISAGLPSASQAEYTSEIYRIAEPFTFFRYNVTKTYGDKKYFNLAQFALYDVTINTYNPETDEEN